MLVKVQPEIISFHKGDADELVAFSPPPDGYLFIPGVRRFMHNADPRRIQARVEERLVPLYEDECYEPEEGAAE